MAQLSLLVLVADSHLSLDLRRVSAAIHEALLRGALARIHRLAHLGPVLLKRASRTRMLIFAAESVCLYILVRIVVLTLVLSDSVDFV